jgi:hypothetical protein
MLHDDVNILFLQAVKPTLYEINHLNLILQKDYLHWKSTYIFSLSNYVISSKSYGTNFRPRWLELRM